MRHRLRAIAAGATACAVASSLFAGEAPNIGPQIRIDVNGGTAGANEISIAVSEANPDCIVAAWQDWRLGDPPPPEHYMAVALSTDGGQTWDDFLLRPPAPFQSDLEIDPMTAYDNRTGTLWVGAVTGGEGMYVARMDPGSEEFEPSVMAYAGRGSDKGWMAAGPRPNLPTATRLYITEANGIYWSDDMGETWTIPIPLGANLGWLPRVASNGTL